MSRKHVAFGLPCADMTSGPTVIIGTSLLRHKHAQLWGDTHMAQDIGAALKGLNWKVRFERYQNLHLLRRRPNTVMLYLRGLRPCPRTRIPLATWLVSHPETFSGSERSRSAAFFSASPTIAREMDGTHLPQATDAKRFRPSEGPSHPLLFVGNSRKQPRTAVAHAIRADLPITVFGRGWKEVFPQLQLAGNGLPNSELAGFYTNATVVLNDHWPDMAAAGILSNRVYDALACGAQILTDAVDDLPQEIGRFVTTYSSYSEYRDGVAAIQQMSLDDRDREGRIARNLILERHTFEHRAVVLDAQLRGLLET